MCLFLSWKSGFKLFATILVIHVKSLQHPLLCFVKAKNEQRSCKIFHIEANFKNVSGTKKPVPTGKAQRFIIGSRRNVSHTVT